MRESSVQNVAGEFERERFSPTANFVEAMLMMVFILGILWVVAYPFGVMGEMPGAQRLSEILIVVGALYMLFVAPFLHRDTATSWGLGNPRALWRLLHTTTPEKRAVLLAVLVALFLALNVMNVYHWERVLRFFNLHRTAMRDWNQGFPGAIGMVGFGSVLALIIVTAAIRYDNFLSAFRTALVIALPLFVLILLGAAAHRGRVAFVDFSIGAFFIGVFGYVFWGFVQQLLFSSYLGTRIRKGFKPSTASTNRVPPDKRLPFVSVFAVAGAFVAALVVFVTLRHSHGDAIPLWSLFAFAVFILPAAAVYAWFFACDRKRLLVATLSGSCFGLIHIDSYGLVAVTFLLGVALTYVFMVDRNRNLVALGFIHGLLGSSFNAFFSRSESGVLEVDYTVGPWNVREPTWGVLIIPILCILFYVAMTLWYLRIHKEP